MSELPFKPTKEDIERMVYLSRKMLLALGYEEPFSQTVDELTAFKVAALALEKIKHEKGIK